MRPGPEALRHQRRAAGKSHMTTLRPLASRVQGAGQSIGRACTVFLRDVGHGLLEVSHNTFALLGFVVAAIALFAASRAELRHDVENHMLSWLQTRQEARTEGTAEALLAMNEPEAILRATAADPKHLTREQASVAMWLSRRYRVAPEPV